MAELRTPEQKKQIVENCIDIEMAGGSVLDYLAAEGYVTPKATWVNLQKKYLGRKDDRITDGQETGVKKKGKRPQIRAEALKQDEFDYQIAMERADEERKAASAPEAVLFGGKEYEKAPVVTCCARSTREGVEVPDELPDDLTEEAPQETPEEAQEANEEPQEAQEEDLEICAAVAKTETPDLIALKLKSGSGYWEMISEENMIQFWAHREGGFTAIRLSVEDWRKVIGEFPQVCRMMGICKQEGQDA